MYSLLLILRLLLFQFTKSLLIGFVSFAQFLNLLRLEGLKVSPDLSFLNGMTESANVIENASHIFGLVCVYTLDNAYLWSFVVHVVDCISYYMAWF